MKTCIIIPARLASTRLPRKLLLCDTGKSLLQHTYEAASRSQKASSICIAADGEEIAREVRSFGGTVRLTDPQLSSGTDRVAAVAVEMDDVDIIVNLQADEPELSAENVDQLIQILEDSPKVNMATLATPICDTAKILDPSCVKVVLDKHNRAFYFSRSPIPHVRDKDDGAAVHLLHLGIYAYRREFLVHMAQQPPTLLEKVEKLEQLRILTLGHTILVGIVDQPSIGIDTHDDYQAFVARYRKKIAHQEALIL